MEPVYVCKYGGYHNKPCKTKINDAGLVEIEPSSQNLWIYTAYAKILGFHVDTGKLIKTYKDSLTENQERLIKSEYKWYMTRLPGRDDAPPMSRDEFIGIYYLLGNDALYRVINRDWTWYNKNFVNVGFWDKLKGFKDLVKWNFDEDKHFTYPWRTNQVHTYPILFNFMPHDRYYFQKTFLGKSNLLYWAFFQLYCLITVTTGKHYVKNLLWMQLVHLNSKFWIRFIKRKKNFLDYFEKDHPFCKL